MVTDNCVSNPLSLEDAIEVFTSKAKAEKFVKEYQKSYPHNLYIEKYLPFVEGVESQDNLTDIFDTLESFLVEELTIKSSFTVDFSAKEISDKRKNKIVLDLVRAISHEVYLICDCTEYPAQEIEYTLEQKINLGKKLTSEEKDSVIKLLRNGEVKVSKN